ncbi:glycosyltransferase family 39 protein [Rhizobium sp. TRM96647]|uniref:ArnT family glycosyltransferase n=1 Tax=unclassified Rhizobium TaxID=2613769 RepID=UPI0021E97C6C|nr:MULTISPECIES: glycosyltransferase family 39 protein [unclassified Rhizobium]MCV3738568.1 glycosyltransferase family 39 protein [Rhizobium sp. TRM96647]MCV3760255.1 glycosyltransferase family 39 protein [Rhizobium sp. TRM96650]
MTRFLRASPNAVFILLAAYFAVNFLVRMALPDSLERDEAQQVLLSQWLAAGYDTQPPFYNWLQYALIQITGPSVFAISLLKNLMLFAAYLAYGLAARTVLKDRDLAIIATLSLLTIPQIAFEAQRDLTHTVAVVFAAALFLFGFLRTLAAPTALSYLVAGVAIGIGMIAKYNFALLPAAGLLAILFDREWRQRLFDWRLLLTAGASLVIVAPHALWLFDHLALASGGTMDKLSDGDTGISSQILEGLLSLVTAVLGFSAVTVVVFAIVFRGGLWTALKAGNRWTGLIEAMMAFFLLALLLLILFAGAAHIKDRWLTPLLLVLPLYLCLKIEAAGRADPLQLKRFVPIAAAVMIAVPAILFGRVAAAGLTGDYQKLNVPYDAFARQVAQEGVAPAVIFTDDTQLAGNLRLHFPGTPVFSENYADFAPDITWSAQAPVMVVWRNEDGSPAEVSEELLTDAIRFGKGPPAAAPDLHRVELPYHYGRDGDRYSFSYAWVYPAGE